MDVLKQARELSGRHKKMLIVAGAVLILLAVAALWYFVFVDNIAQTLTVEAGTSVSAEDFKLRKVQAEAEILTDMSGVDTSLPGAYPVSVRYYGRIHDCILQVVDSVAPVLEVRDLSVFSTQKPDPEDFIVDTLDQTKVFYAFDEKPDMTIAGVQQVRILAIDLGGNITAATADLSVIFDTTAPVLTGVKDLRQYLDYTVEYLADISVTDDLDSEPTVTVDDSEVDLSKPGTYTVRYIARDISGNETVERAELTIIHDMEGPQILGVNKLSMYQGSTISYRSGVLVTDNYDEAPVLSIDSSQVNLTEPGTYTVTYTATDEVGNETVLETTLTVKKQPSNYVEASVVYAKADEILAQIITEDMTTREQVEAIYKWFRKNCSYVSYSDKTDRLQGAYKMMTRKYGDCFNYYAACSVMLERLGIPQISVERSRNSVRQTRHYWSMVSLDGGQTYYHLDVSPHYTFAHISTCLVTDAVLKRCNLYLPGYYTMDEGVYPATPTE